MRFFLWFLHLFYEPILVKSSQRGLLFLNEKFRRPLEPGLCRVPKWPDLRIITRLWDTRNPVVTDVDPNIEQFFPEDWVRKVEIDSGHVALAYVDGVPKALLRPGRHLLWSLDRPPTVEVFNVEKDPLPPLTPELLKLLRPDDYEAKVIPAESVGLLIRDGKYQRFLPPGMHGFWKGGSQLEIAVWPIRSKPFFPYNLRDLPGVRLQEEELGPDQGLLVWFDGLPGAFLARPGRHLVVTEGYDVRTERFDLTKSAHTLSRAQKAVIPSSELAEVSLEANEVGILTCPGRSRKPEVLPPGQSIWWTRGETLQCRKIDWLRDPVVPRAFLDIVPEWTTEVSLERHHCAVVVCGGRPVKVLTEGVYRLWNPELAQEGATPRGGRAMRLKVEVIDTREYELNGREAWINLLPAGSHVVAEVQDGQVGIVRRNGRVSSTVEPGIHYFWCLEEQVAVEVMENRPRVLKVSSQEMLTKDKVSLRLNLAVVYRVVDPLLCKRKLEDPDELLYLKLQLASRRFVSSRSLDDLLGERDQLEQELRQRLEEQVSDTGLRIDEVGLKDLILPGRTRQILNQVVEARQRAEANLITRREETAATRSLANTARVLANNPVLLRLKELDHVKEIAEKIGQVHLLVSSKDLGGLMGFPGSGSIFRLGEGSAVAEKRPREAASAPEEESPEKFED